MIKFGAILLLFGCVVLTTAKQRHADLTDIPVSELQRLKDVAKGIQSKIIVDLGHQMNINRKPTATIADRMKQEELTKKMIALKLFMQENHKEQAKRRWTRDADWVSEDGNVEWSLDYSHGDEAWIPTNPNKPPPAVKNSPSKAPVKQKSLATSGKAPPSHDDTQYSDHDSADDDNQLMILMSVGIGALLLSTVFIIYTTIQWVRTLEALRKSEASNRENEMMRLLEEHGDPELGNQIKDYVSLDFDAMVGLVDTSDIPATSPKPSPKPSRTSCGSDPMVPNDLRREKPPRPSVQKMTEFKKRNNL